MKQFISLLLSALMVLTLAACGNQSQTDTAENETAAPQVQEAMPEQEQPEAAEPAAETAAEQTETAEGQENEKVLVIYFSAANTAEADVVSSATPRVDGLGATEYLAQLIHEQVGGDLAKITPETDYPEDFDGTADAAKEEQVNDQRPGFTVEVNPEDYDTIYIGYPIWWYTRPMLLYSFFDAYDFSGKTLIPFNTHAGSRDSGTYTEIEEAEPDATVLEGLAVAGDEVGADTEQTVRVWLEELANEKQ